MAMFRCWVCEGKGVLKDAILAWDEGEQAPKCDYCNGRGWKIYGTFVFGVVGLILMAWFLYEIAFNCCK